MRQHQRTTRIKSVFEVLHASADFGGALVGPVHGVDVGAEDVVVEVAEGVEDGLVGAKVWRAHVGWVFADDGVEGVLELGHLRDDGGLADGGEVGVGPSADVRRGYTDAIALGLGPGLAHTCGVRSGAPRQACAAPAPATGQS